MAKKTNKPPPKPPAVAESPPTPRHCTVEHLAKLLQLSVRRIQALRADGAFVTEKTPDGMRYILVDSLVSYALYLRGNEEDEALKTRELKATVRIKEAKAKKEETLLQLLRGDVHKGEHVRQLFGDMISTAQSIFLPLSKKCAVKCDHVSIVEAETVIEKEVHRALSNMVSLGYDPEKFHNLVREDGEIIFSTTIDADDDD